MILCLVSVYLYYICTIIVPVAQISSICTTTIDRKCIYATLRYMVQQKVGEITDMSTAKQKIRKICEQCGKPFEADRISTKYCSHECNRTAYKTNRRKVAVKLSEELSAKKSNKALRTTVEQRAYLGITEAAKLLGVSRWSVYRYVSSGMLPATRITKRTTRIKKVELETFIDNASRYEMLKQDQEQKPIADWYTLEEITLKYGIKYRQVRKIITLEGIPERKNGRYTLVAQKPIDTYFKKRGFKEALQSLAEWVSISGIMTEYNMSETAVYSFISAYKIPKKQLNGKRYYSKLHIDDLKKQKP